MEKLEQLGNGLFHADPAQAFPELGGNAVRVWRGIKAVFAARHRRRRHCAGNENKDIEFRCQVAGVQRLWIGHLEGELELLQQPAHPARRHRAAVAVP